jgi:hypothetical protein
MRLSGTVYDGEGARRKWAAAGRTGGLFRLFSDPFLILTPGSLRPSSKAFIAAGILYFTKVFVFGDVAP